MTKQADTVRDTRVNPSLPHANPTGKNRGYDELAPFLHEVNKIVAEECAIHANPGDLPWYAIWEKWNDLHLLRCTAINAIGKIVCPDLKYTERTIKQVISKIMSAIPPVSRYIQVNHLSDTSVQWESLIEVDNFRSMKRKSSKKSASRKDTKLSYRENSPSQSHDDSTLSSNNPPIPKSTKDQLPYIVPIS